MKLFFLLLFFPGISNYLFSIHVEINMEPVDNASLADYNFNRKSYLNYQKEFMDTLEVFFSGQRTRQDLKIIQTLDPKALPYYTFAARPALPDSVRHALQKKLMSLRTIQSLYLPYSTAFYISINGGSLNRKSAYSPILETPFDQRRKPYETGNLAERHAYLQKWASEGAIPVIIEIMNQKPVAPGMTFGEWEINSVRNLWKTDTMRQYLSISPVQNFPENPQLVPVLKTLFLVWEGRFSYALTYMQMICQYEPPGSLLRYLLDELNWRLNYYFEKEQALLQNKDDKRIQHILTINPNSEGALYALIHKKGRSEDLDQGLKNANPMRTKILEPLTKTEAYTNHLRTTMVDFFIDPERYESDFPRYAEMALRLGNYDFAADCYWMLLRGSDFEEELPLTITDPPLREKDEEKTALYRQYYDYAIHKLLHEDPPTDKKTRKQFKRLDKKYRKQMKKHSAYKQFKP